MILVAHEACSRAWHKQLVVLQFCKTSLAVDFCPALILTITTALPTISLASNSLVFLRRSCALAGVGVCEWLVYREPCLKPLNLVLRAPESSPTITNHHHPVAVPDDWSWYNVSQPIPSRRLCTLAALWLCYCNLK